MGKVDYNRDYYKDLEVDPTTDIADIKKAFRRLALLHHPDRNLGDEDNAAKKFQQVNAAAEILLDPEQRKNYDAVRSHRPGFTGASGVRGNRYAGMAEETNAKYGAPPTRANRSNARPTARPTTRPAPTARYTAHTNPPPPPPPPPPSFSPPRESRGAQNYQKFAKAAPTSSAYKATQNTTEARKSTYEGWESMRHRRPQSEGEEYGTRTPPRPPPRANGFANYRDTDDTPNRTSSTRRRPVPQDAPPSVPPRKGYMPSTPGVGDEPPATMGAYKVFQRQEPMAPPPMNSGTSTSSTAPPPPTANTRPSPPLVPHARPAPDSSATQPPRRPPKDPFDLSNLKNPLNDLKQSSTDERTSTPYATHGGERLNPFDSPSTNPSNIFNFSDVPNQESRPRPSFSSSAENISTSFASKNWDGTFSAGGSNPFLPTQNAPRSDSFNRPRAKSTTRIRQSSPIKGSQHSVSPSPAHSTGPSIFGSNIFGAGAGSGQSTEPQPAVSPGGQKFAPEHWQQSINTDAFMPPPSSTSMPLRNGMAARRKPSLRPTKGGNAVMVEDSTSDEAPTHFSGRNDLPRRVSQPRSSSMRNSYAQARVSSPDPMDIDPETPPKTATVEPLNTTVPQFSANNNVSGGAPMSKPKRSNTAPKSSRQSSTTQPTVSSLNSGMADLRVQDLLSTLEMPATPIPPEPPRNTADGDRPTPEAYTTYKQVFKQYLSTWDTFDRRFLLHFVTRRQQSDTLGEKRLTLEGGRRYRAGLKEDQVVLERWEEGKRGHEKAMRDWEILRDKVEGEG